MTYSTRLYVIRPAQTVFHPLQWPATKAFTLSTPSVVKIPYPVDENPTYSVPALQGYEGLWSYDYGHA